MGNGPADGGPPFSPADDATPRQWQQRAGFSVFFDIQPGGPGELRRRTRLYHEETGDEATFPDAGPADWVRWMLDRLASAQPASEAIGMAGVAVEVLRLPATGDPAPRTGDRRVGGGTHLRGPRPGALRRASSSPR